MMLRVVWDEAKAQRNLAKHGIAFTVAENVFLDPFVLTELDRVEEGERRWRSTGLVDGVLVLVVAHTLEDDAGGGDFVRIISARRADRTERRRYDRERLGRSGA
jgi:uncharacterized DUF497 family protein